MPSYIEALKKMVRPQAEGKLRRLVRNFDEKIKDPESPEAKALASFIAMQVALYSAEKVMAEAYEIFLYARKLSEREVMDKRRSGSAEVVNVEEQREENLVGGDLSTALTDARAQLDEIYKRADKLKERYEQSLNDLDVLQKGALHSAAAAHVGTALSSEHLKEVANIYEQRSLEKGKFQETLVNKAMKPSQLQPSPSPQKKEDIKMEEMLAPRRAEAKERFDQGIGRIGSALDVNTQMLMLAFLKNELQSGFDLRVILATGNSFMTVLGGFETFRNSLKQDYEGAISKLNQQAKECETVLHELEGKLGKPVTTRELKKEMEKRWEAAEESREEAKTAPTFTPFNTKPH